MPANIHGFHTLNNDSNNHAQPTSGSRFGYNRLSNPGGGQGEGGMASGGQDYLTYIKEKIKSWNENCPIITKYITYITLVFYFLSFFLNNLLIYMFIDTPKLTLFKFQIWRIFTNPFVENSFFNVLLTIFFIFPNNFIKIENSLGSSAFLILNLYVLLFISIIFNFSCLLLSYMSSNSLYLNQFSSTTWNLIFAFMVLDHMRVSY